MKFLFLFLIFFCSISQADILFLDLNNSPKEIEAAERAAIKRNEKLIVIPKLTTTQAKATQQSRDRIARAQARVGQVCAGNYNSPECRRATEEGWSTINEEASKLNFVDDKSLKAELQNLKKKGVKISSMVVSGHDGNGHFAGVYGSLNDQDIQEAFAEAQPLGENLRGMYLWGCYTSNIGSLLQNWKKAFPQAELIAGYDGSAPLGDKPANWRYLEDVIVKEKQLTAIKDEKVLQKALNQIDGVNLVNASVCVDDKYASKSKALNLRDAQNLCKKIIEETQELYTCYLHAQPRCENPPENTSSSELRSLYNRLQDARHCNELNGGRQLGGPSPEVTLRLIFFKNIKENFVNNDPGFIGKYNNLLKEVGAPESLQWGDLRSMTRAEILKKLNEQNDFLTAAAKSERVDLPEIQAIQSARFNLQQVLGDLDVGFDWVEPGLRTQTVARMANGIDKSIKKSRDIYEGSRASKSLRLKMEELMLADPQYGAEYKAMVEENDALSAQIYKEKNYRKEVMDKYDKNAKRILEKQREILPAIEEKMKTYSQELKNQPYAHEEGKKVFGEKLDSILADKTQVDLLLQIPASMMRNSTQGMGFGTGSGMGSGSGMGFGFGMGLGLGGALAD